MTDRDTLFRVMKKQNCSSGEIIIKEGDDVMYIIDDGEFMVYKLQKLRGRREQEINVLLFTYTTEGATLVNFLMYGPRGGHNRQN